MSALAGLLEEDAAAISDTKLIDNAWRGAEAYHFYLLAQRQLYDGHAEKAFATAQTLTLYEDIMDPEMIHSLIGTNSYHNLCVVCSRANCMLGFECNLSSGYFNQPEYFFLCEAFNYPA